MQVVEALPHDAHFMGILMAEISALSTCHPEQNPALAGQNIYQSKEIVDKQICRLIGVWRDPLQPSVSQPCSLSLGSPRTVGDRRRLNVARIL